MPCVSRSLCGFRKEGYRCREAKTGAIAKVVVLCYTVSHHISEEGTSR